MKVVQASATRIGSQGTAMGQASPYQERSRFMEEDVGDPILNHERHVGTR